MVCVLAFSFYIQRNHFRKILPTHFPRIWIHLKLVFFLQKSRYENKINRLNSIFEKYIGSIKETSNANWIRQDDLSTN